MKYTKLPIPIKKQIEILKNRGLIFKNETIAELHLSNINYYRLRAYSFPFQDNSNDNHPFVIDVSFEQIIDLYVFDSKLRLVIFESIEKIEIAFRAQIIYHFALENGSHWQLKPELYRDPLRFASHLDSLQKEVDRSNETFIEHYKKKYSNPTQPPCWMTIEVSSLGLLSKIFQNLKKGKEKTTITRYFGLTDISILENWIFCINTLRNICAHHGRVWNRRLTPIKLPTNPTNPFLKTKTIYTNKLYATLSCIVYLLKITTPNNTFSSDLKLLMANCPLAQVKEMGFPINWETEEIWQ